MAAYRGCRRSVRGEGFKDGEILAMGGDDGLEDGGL